MRFETQHFGSEIDMSALGEVTERVEIQLRLPYILVTVCTDIVTVRIRIAYSRVPQYRHMALTAVDTVHIGNSEH